MRDYKKEVNWELIVAAKGCCGVSTAIFLVLRYQRRFVLC